MAGYFRPADGPYARSVVLAELARLWDQSVHRESAEGRTITQKQLAEDSEVPATTLNSWATGASLPRELDQLTRVGGVLAGWAGEKPSAGTVWSQRIAADRKARRTSVAAGGIDRHPGWPLEKMTDPFLLEVHRPIEAGGPKAEALPVLPPYVARAHDERLAQVVELAVGGLSAMAVLVGESSTGKTRACWEALAMLREQGGWRLWHPFDPTRPEAALAELSQVGPHTVVWLNETQHYLDTPGDVGERVAAALRTLLTDSGRAPVLVMGTLWRRNWDILTRSADPDRHAQARVVLAGTDITVEEKFTGTQQQALREAAATDSRLAEALAEAKDGQITQYLAGGLNCWPATATPRLRRGR
ncbi:ATP-binding protein [Streptosporangium vulgare]|uniref:HTH cro/C1-type domain-containing protein n=1 Tax=Streptosporangium vulgare TaxID=46190 RepID=A0ABV5TRC3_9ACTN